MLRERSRRHADEGTSAVLIAFAMVLIMGMAALVIDATGAGFNERRQDQTAADTAVMSGALGFILGEDDTTKVANSLDVARANLDTTYTDPEWQAIWEACVDPDIGAVDVGTGVPQAFTPMPNPFPAPGTASLQCVSKASSYMRVVIPDQSVETSFGRILGFDSLETHAEAIARIESLEGANGLIPFGLAGGTGSGEACLSTNPSGIAEPPCQGSSAGGFGPINSELFGDFFGTPSCSNPGLAELEQNVALGIDHFVDEWPQALANAEGVSEGDPHPGDATIDSYADAWYDRCRISGGVVQPEGSDEFPPNTLRVDTGFPSGPVENGLISNKTYLGQPSRLQDTTNPTQTVVKKQTGGPATLYELDDLGPWSYLTGTGACDSGSYAILSTDAKVALFQTCLTSYSGSNDIFDASIADSPRFAWAPQYWHAPSTTGTSWQPVKDYRMVFIGGLWFNCTAVPGSCGAVFYPDEDTTAPVCDVFGGGCRELNLDQMSAWVLPDEAVPDSVSSAFPGGDVSPFEPTLYR
ncbi:MAG TPA: TadE/TadG family type IV pilus assembly protein [Acidimicrobiia bacterium]